MSRPTGDPPVPLLPSSEEYIKDKFELPGSGMDSTLAHWVLNGTDDEPDIKIVSESRGEASVQTTTPMVRCRA